MFRSIIVPFLCIVSFPAYAYQWSGPGGVTTFYVSPNIKGLYIEHSKQATFTEATTGCSKNELLHHKKTTFTEGYYKEMYSLLLALYTSGKQVSIRVNGCSAEGYPIIDYISAN